MNNLVYLYLLYLPLLGISPDLFSQAITAKEADRLFKEKQYCRALEFYAKSLSTENEILFRKGLCQYHCNQLSSAEQVFLALVEKSKNPPVEAYYWLGRVYQHQQKFSLAKKEFKKYLSQTGTKNEFYDDALVQSQRCIDASFLTRREPWGYLEQLNDKVNSPGHELMPSFSPNYDDRIYFTSNADGSFKVFGAEVGQGTWNPRYLLQESPRPGTQVALLDFNESGQIAYYLEETYGNSRIIADTFSSDGLSRIGVLRSPLDVSFTDHYVQFLSDSVLIFSSNRPGGFGGYDLYLSIARQDGWSHPVNLGQEVNTSADEISPFFTNDGRELYFSSNRPQDNMGGFDIFRIKLDEKNKQWSEVFNLGPPVNSPADDVGLQISSNGRNALFSSNRKSGIGGYDVYFFFIKQPVVSQFFAYGGLPAVIDILFSGPSSVDINPLRQIPLPYLLYSEDDNIFTPENLNKLDQLALRLKELPDYSLDVIVHADNTAGLQNLFFSVKRGEKLLDYLLPKLNLKTPVFLLGAGSEYPIAKNQNNLGPIPAGQKLNRRIEFNLHGPAIMGHQDLPPVSVSLSDSAYIDYKAFKNGLWFKVFVLTASRPVDLSVLGEYPDVTVEKLNNKDGYDYTVGRYSSYHAANRVKEDIRTRGYPDATVYAYVHGRRLAQNEVDPLLKDYPELIKFKERKE